MTGLSETLATVSFCVPTNVAANTALVAEGGGQRGIFTAGVLDSWLYQGFNPFSLLIGTSAGAQNISSYMSCQKGFARRAIFGLTQNRQFFNAKRSLYRRDVVDLDWYFQQFDEASIKLNVEQAVARADHESRTILFSATCTANRRAEFFQPEVDNWLELLKASSALPLLYRNGVQVGENNYVDGGLSAPIPVQEAYHIGAKRIVVIRTVPPGSEIESPWAHKLKSWLCTSKRCPAVIDLITHHENAYKQAIEFIKHPPSDCEIIEVYPTKTLASRLVNSRFKDLDQDYNEGVRAGLAFLENIELDLVA